MLREKYENCKTFVKEHKTEIMTGVTCSILIGGAALIGFSHLKNELKKTNRKVAKNNDIAKRALNLHWDKAKIERDAIADSITRLDPDVPINKFHTIPERELAMADLDAFMKYVESEIKACED